MNLLSYYYHLLNTDFATFFTGDNKLSSRIYDGLLEWVFSKRKNHFIVVLCPNIEYAPTSRNSSNF